MAGKTRKHKALVIRRQVEKAVPSNQAIKLLVYIKLTHIFYVPAVLWKTRAAQRNQFFGRINTGHSATALDAIARYRFARTTADIQNMR